MAAEDEMKQMNKNGILVYQLPSKYIQNVLDSFPKECILNYFHDPIGFHVYFYDADHVVQCAYDRAVEIKGQLFNIYLTVTNLTLHDVANYTQDIKTLVEFNGYEDIVDFYPVEKLEEHERHKSFKMTADYRVILNVPEIFANYDLKPMRCPEQPNYAFCVSFFCRICRQNGHKAYQCPNYFHIDSTAGNSVFGRTSHEYYSQSLETFKMRHFKLQSATTAELQRRQISVSAPSSSIESPRFVKIEPNIDVQNNAVEGIEEQVEPQTDSNQKLRRQVSLSEGIKQAIRLESNGVLPPEKMINFLNHVRGRQKKTVLEIALTAFTTNISDLIHQLESVEKNYFNAIKIKGPEEDRDLRFLRSLQNRLKEQMNVRQQEEKSSQEQPTNSKFRVHQ